MSKFRILSLDGGGIRGIYTAVLLDRLVQRAPAFMEQIDLFAGTSTGGIMALRLAFGLTPAQGVSLYREFGADVFRDSALDDLFDLLTVVGAEYSLKPLKAILARLFGDATLGDLAADGRFVLIPTFDLDAVKNGVRSWKPKFFHNIPGEDADNQQLIVDVALRTSAAPTYFPTYQGYIDGGVVANNPSMAALAQALCDPNNLRKPEDIRLLSLGTGAVPRYIDGDQLDWGYGQWAKPLIPIMLEGSMGVADYQCDSILRETGYHRLAPLLPHPIKLDDVDKIDLLVQLAHAVDIEETISWLEDHFV